MTEHLTTILQWLIPSGGLGAVIAWMTSRIIRQTRLVKEVHDTYKVMYDDVSKTLLEVRDENEKLYKVVGKLERAISRATMCRYWHECPIRAELSDSKGIIRGKIRGKSPGQPHIRSPSVDNNGSATRESDNTDPDKEPP